MLQSIIFQYQNNVKLKDVVITENREYHYCIDQCGEGSNCPKDSSDKETCWGINKCQKSEYYYNRTQIWIFMFYFTTCIFSCIYNQSLENIDS